MDIGMIQGAIVSLKAASDIAIAFGNLKTMADVQGKAIELQQIILAAQSSALAAQSQHFSLLDQIRELEKEIAKVKAWDEQKQRYALVAPWQGAVVYALKKESANSEPAHWICTRCYEDGRRSILSDILKVPTTGPRHVGLDCPVCKSHVPSSWSGGQITRTYAEDTIAS